MENLLGNSASSRQKISVASISAFIVTLLIIIAMIAQPLQAATATATITVTYKQSECRAMLSDLNTWRLAGAECATQSGGTEFVKPTKALTYDYNLERIAMQRAAEAAVSFSHTRPNGESCFTCVYNSTSSNGECLAAGQRTALEAFEAWKEENETYDYQGHRRLMINPNYLAIGIAGVEYNGRMYWVLEFGTTIRNTTATTANNSTQNVSFSYDTANIKYMASLSNSISTSQPYGNVLDIPTVTVKKYVGNCAIGDVTSTTTVSWSTSDSSVISISGGKFHFNKKGTATLTLTIKSGSTVLNTQTYTITVGSCSISNSQVVVSTIADQAWRGGSEITPSVTITHNGRTLVEGTDYTVSAARSNTVISNTYVTITGTGNYSGTRMAYFAIVPADISSATISGISNKTFTGSSITQSPTVTLNGNTLSTACYSITYENNINTGTATMTITGKGCLTGSVTRTFKITPASMTDVTVNIMGTYPWNGGEVTPVPVVKLNNITLQEGRDFTLTYSDNTEIGTATVTITGTGNITGSTSTTFTIGKCSISSSLITVDAVPAQDWTGSAITPSVNVYINGTLLTEGEDYTLSYYNNINPASGSTKPVIYIRGAGEHFNSSSYRTVNFDINPIDISNVVVSGITDKSYTGRATTQTPVLTYNGRTVSSSNYSLSYENNTAQGTATVTITGQNGLTGSLNYNYEIIECDIESATVTGISNSYNYTGSSITPVPTVKIDGVTMTAGEDYIVTYRNNIDAGTATIILTGNGVITGTKEITFTINKISLTYNSNISIDAIEDQTWSNSVTPAVHITFNGIDLVKDQDYTVSYRYNTTAGSSAYAYISGIGNFSGYRNVYFTIVARSIEDCEVADIADQSWSGYQLQPAVSLTYNGATVSSTHYTVSYSENTSVGTATVTITGRNGLTGIVTKTFEIVPANIETVASVSGVFSSYTYSGTPVTCSNLLVRRGSTTLLENTDYTVSYSDNNALGTATLTITGTGNYNGTITKTFKLTTSIGSATLDPIANVTFNGEPATPTVVLHYDGRTLVEGEDYTLSYSNNTAVGRGWVTITGAGYFTGSRGSSFNIVAPVTNTPAPTNTVAPTATNTPRPTNTNAPVPTNTVAPTATSTPRPTNTSAPVPTTTVAPTATSTPRPTNTSAPVPTTIVAPTATNTPVPTATNTPVPAPTLPPFNPDDMGEGVEGFVQRLYTVVMSRDAEPAGQSYWVNLLNAKRINGGEAARFFLLSDEFVAKNYENSDFVEILYRLFFGRTGDSAGTNYWVSCLEAGWSREDVIRGFVNSNEWATICASYKIASGGTGIPQQVTDFATRLYTTCLGREGEVDGINYWAALLTTGNVSGREAAHQFFFCAEFTSGNHSDREFISRLYQTFMNRTGSDFEIDYWLSEMESGKNREDIFNGFATSPEFSNLCQEAGIQA